MIYIAPTGDEHITDTWADLVSASGDLIDAEYEFLSGDGSHIADLWYEFLGTKGYTGTLSERMFAWQADGNTIEDSGGGVFDDSVGVFDDSIGVYDNA